MKKKFDRMAVVETPTDKEFGKRFWKQFFLVIGMCFAFAVAAVVILIIMGALKALGVKSLEG